MESASELLGSTAEQLPVATSRTWRLRLEQSLNVTVQATGHPDILRPIEPQTPADCLQEAVTALEKRRVGAGDRVVVPESPCK